MSWQSAFAAGPCTVDVYVATSSGDLTLAYSDVLGLGGSATFDDPINDGESMTVSVDPFGVVLLTSTLNPTTLNQIWQAAVTPTTGYTDSRISDYYTAANHAAVFDGAVDGQSFSGVTVGLPCEPNPSPLPVAAPDRFGVYAHWGFV